jgi:hypothetical protein
VQGRDARRHEISRDRAMGCAQGSLVRSSRARNPVVARLTSSQVA